MRHLTLFITFCLFLWLASSTPINKNRRLINRPTKEQIFGMRDRRHAFEYEVKGRPYPSTRPQHPELSLRKGEYICRGRVCKLNPGEIPSQCNGVCQYPI